MPLCRSRNLLSTLGFEVLFGQYTFMKQFLRMAGTLALIGAIILLFFSRHFETLEKGAKPVLPATMRAPSGQQVDIAALQNKPMVVNFWATWCPPCRQEMPELVKVANRFASSVQFLGIAAQSPVSDLRKFQEAYKIPYPIVLGDDHLMNAWKAESLPLTYFLNASGEVVGSHVGAITESELESVIQRLLLNT